MFKVKVHIFNSTVYEHNIGAYFNNFKAYVHIIVAYFKLYKLL